ncbi:hypothetical protein BGZ80_005283 [Entomortierella chlamydospora]|uniref:Uncharacterized protein n=1 Tax=Entomortierella chlamydospora TaxID=101097 RepID=A0A9P6MZN3_9FUNG|nr:hypothetical protein BGZ79_002935 [Entomortierella chlamydospora]KAG0019782.1 hypothetical protein BGZ80_005283 [Entomortierella chlamydospora]
MTRIHFTPLLAAVALLALTTAAPSPSHLLSDQDLSALAPPDLSTLSAPIVAPVAAPIAPVAAPVASASPQVIPPQDISVGSETGVFPVTGVYPSLIYRPAIQLYDPLVSFQSGDDGSSDYGVYGGYGGYGFGGYSYDASPYIANGPAGVINRRQVPTGPSGQPSGVVGSSSDVATNTVIQPIVRIQPHALQPVPVPSLGIRDVMIANMASTGAVIATGGEIATGEISAVVGTTAAATATAIGSAKDRFGGVQ